MRCCPSEAMSAEQLRYEYRVFDRRLRSLAYRLAAEGGEAGFDGGDVRYLVGADTDRNVKIRDGALEAKVRLECCSGLQRWMPLASRPFPLDRDWILGELPSLLPEVAPAPTRPVYDLESFLGELPRWAPDVAVIAVRKRRTRYVWGGVRAEHVAVELPGRPCESVAVEGADATAVAGAVARLGLHIRPNQSYVAALTQHHPLPWVDATPVSPREAVARRSTA